MLWTWGELPQAAQVKEIIVNLPKNSVYELPFAVPVNKTHHNKRCVSFNLGISEKKNNKKKTNVCRSSVPAAVLSDVSPEA